jgi:hypothetical protein
VSVISEIVAGIVGIGGLAFGWKQSTLRLGQERTLADLAAVRDVIEQGAIHLHRVAYALDPVKLDLEANAREAHAALEPLGREYDELVERLNVRLGPDHEVVREFAGANDATLDAFPAVQRVVKLHLQHIESGGLAAKQATVLLDKDRDVLTAARERFDRHRGLFIDSGARTAGGKLPSS